LGHLVGKDGVRVDPKKIEAMQDWPHPKTLKILRGFFGLTRYYRKLVKNYGKIATPLTTLLKKNSFTWTPAAAQAFQTLKTTMCTTPVLALPDFTKTFVLECDTSGKGIDVVLMQEGRPLSFTSKQLSERILGKPIYEKEMLAILHTVESWRPYLLGQRFQIKTDHQSLKYFLEQRISSQEQQNGSLSSLDMIMRSFTIRAKTMSWRMHYPGNMKTKDPFFLFPSLYPIGCKLCTTNGFKTPKVRI
jgi:hypothetical protein